MRGRTREGRPLRASPSLASPAVQLAVIGWRSRARLLVEKRRVLVWSGRVPAPRACGGIGAGVAVGGGQVESGWRAPNERRGGARRCSVLAWRVTPFCSSFLSLRSLIKSALLPGENEQKMVHCVLAEASAEFSVGALRLRLSCAII
jgi:hypothetical protein